MSITDSEPPGCPEPAGVSIRMIWTRLSRAISRSRPTSGFAISSRLLCCSDHTGPPRAAQAKRATGEPSRLGGITLGDPPGQPFIEDEHVAVAGGVEDAVGPPGQLVGARSVEEDEVLTRDVVDPPRQLPERKVPGSPDVALLELLAHTDVDEAHGLLEIDEGLRLGNRHVALGNRRIPGGRGAQTEQGQPDHARQRRARDEGPRGHWNS